MKAGIREGWESRNLAALGLMLVLALGLFAVMVAAPGCVTTTDPETGEEVRELSPEARAFLLDSDTLLLGKASGLGALKMALSDGDDGTKKVQAKAAIDQYFYYKGYGGTYYDLLARVTGNAASLASEGPLETVVMDALEDVYIFAVLFLGEAEADAAVDPAILARVKLSARASSVGGWGEAP